jgi:hypothetical protein
MASNMLPTIIHYIDLGEYYSIYGIVTLIIVLLLLWYFVRSSLMQDTHCHLSKEGLDNPDGTNGDFGELGLSEVTTPTPAIKLTPDGEEPKYKLRTGTYGDVPVVFFDEKDLLYANEWGHGNAMYIPNTRSSWESANTPWQKTFWGDDKDKYLGYESEFNGETILVKK